MVTASQKAVPRRRNSRRRPPLPPRHPVEHPAATAQAAVDDVERPRDSIFSRPTPSVPTRAWTPASVGPQHAQAVTREASIQPDPAGLDSGPRTSDQFWESAPRYSEPGADEPLEVARPEALPPASPTRRRFAQFLFVVLFVPAFLLFAWGVATACNVRWTTPITGDPAVSSR